MFGKLLEKLEVILEPQIDSSQYVTHYQPALKYKKKLESIAYEFEIKDETYLNDYIVKNAYTQELQVKLSSKGNNNEYYFEIDTVNSQFNLDKTLIEQGKLLESLAQLTKHVDLKVTEKGTIKSIDYTPFLKKWDKLKEQLLKTYQGSQAKGYINGIDAKLKNENLFLEELKEVKLFGLLFNNYQAAHENDRPRSCKISNLIHCLPVTFKEKIQEIREDKDLQEKHIAISGTMENLGADIESRIQKYITHFDSGSIPIILSNYKRNVILDLVTGYPKSVNLDIELTNSKGYIRKQCFNLKMKNNGN